jgi:hypothetical protein
MYVLSRMLLIATTLVALYCLAIFAALAWPWSGWGLAIAAFACATNKGRRRLTSLGSARWADAETDLRQKGMLYADEGLIIGVLQ